MDEFAYFIYQNFTKKKQQSMLTLWIDVNQCQQIGVANFVRK
jgi:hypothetical protein